MRERGSERERETEVYRDPDEVSDLKCILRSLKSEIIGKKTRKRNDKKLKKFKKPERV